MRSLNEHAGAGHTIPIPSVLLTSLVSPGELMAMSKNEMKDLTDRKEKQEAEGCSESVASLHDGKSCVGTSIHFMRERPTLAFVRAFSLITNICSNVTAQTQSAKALDACTGIAYFKYQQKCFEDHYRVYDGRVEGIRNARESDGQKCHFHAYVQNYKVLNPDGWSDICVKRVNAPARYRTTVTKILANFTTSHLNESQMEISVRNFH